MTDLPKRPDFGTLGRPIQLKTNFYKLDHLPQDPIHHYQLIILPESSRLTNRNVFLKWEQLLPPGIKTVFDGKQNLFCNECLPIKLENVQIELLDDRFEDDKIRSFSLSLRKIKEIDVSMLQKETNALSENALLCLDIILRHRSSLEFTPMGKNLYSERGASSISRGLQLWKGFHQSIRHLDAGTLVNIDIATSAFYEPGPVLSSIVKVLGFHSMHDLLRPFSKEEWIRVARYLTRVRVKSDYNGMKRKWRISGITETSSCLTFFDQETDKGSIQVSVAGYFATQHGITLQYANLPCLIVGNPEKGIFIPMEKELMRFTSQVPNFRAQNIDDGCAQLLNKEDSYLSTFNLSVDPEMVHVPARVLDPPSVCCHPHSPRSPLLNPKDGAWSMSHQCLVAPAVLNSWCLFALVDEVDVPRSILENFVHQLIIACKDSGIIVGEQNPLITYVSPYENLETTFENAKNSVREMGMETPSLFICILSPSRHHLYPEIKRVGDTIAGIPTQCILSKNIQTSKHLASLVLKINVKLGGSNFIVPPHELPLISDEPVIIFGADVTHPPFGDNLKPSIAAVVASLDSNFSRYTTAIRTQAPRKETIGQLQAMVFEHLQTFIRKRETKPARILFYRDGVPSGQFREILEVEVAAIKKACSLIDEGYTPTITFVIVQKRHHTRLFPLRAEDADRSGNVQPGTVVDRGITHPFEFDFYLASHAGVRGTSRPTHYHVLHDENGFNADSLQELTYKLCYLYCRAPRSVSLVPPAYYAHLVASRARFHGNDRMASDDFLNLPVQMKEYRAVAFDLQEQMYFV